MTQIDVGYCVLLSGNVKKREMIVIEWRVREVSIEERTTQPSFPAEHRAVVETKTACVWGGPEAKLEQGCVWKRTVVG